MRKIRVLFLSLFLITFLSQILFTKKKEINVYSNRHYSSDKMLYQQFKDRTGIKVNVVNAKADELIKRLELEGKDTKADILMTVDVGRLYRAKEKDLFQSIDSRMLERNIPRHLRDPEGYWYGLTKRARVIVYNPRKVKKRELTNYEDLIDLKWKNRIVIRSSGNVYNQSLLASMYANDEIKAKEWARGIVNNMARDPKGNDRDQIKAVARGDADIAIVNTYYVGLLKHSSDPKERRVGRSVRIFFPNQKNRGTHVNISGAGITKYAKNKKYGIKLLEFLSGRRAQSMFVKNNFEYPVNPLADLSRELRSWGRFKEDKINLSLIGKYNENALKIFDEVSWK